MRLNPASPWKLNESSDQVADFNMGNSISGRFSGADLRVSRLFRRQCIFPGITKAPKSASIVLVSLVCYFLLGRGLHHDVVVSHIPQAVLQTVEIKLTYYAV